MTQLMLGQEVAMVQPQGARAPSRCANPALHSHPWVLRILEAGEQNAARQSPRRCP